MRRWVVRDIPLDARLTRPPPYPPLTKGGIYLAAFEFSAEPIVFHFRPATPCNLAM
jgi:hypothetical protein